MLLLRSSRRISCRQKAAADADATTLFLPLGLGAAAVAVARTGNLAGSSEQRGWRRGAAGSLHSLRIFVAHALFRVSCINIFIYCATHSHTLHTAASCCSTTKRQGDGGRRQGASSERQAATIMMMMCKLAVGRLISTLAQAQTPARARNCATARTGPVVPAVAPLATLLQASTLLPGAAEMRLVMPPTDSVPTAIKTRLRCGFSIK